MKDLLSKINFSWQPSWWPANWWKAKQKQTTGIPVRKRRGESKISSTTIFTVLLVVVLAVAFWPESNVSSADVLISSANAEEVPTPIVVVTQEVEKKAPIENQEPAPTEIPLPTASPKTYVIWSRDAEYVYFLEEPGQTIIGTLYCGDIVQLLNDPVVQHGQYEWQAVEHNHVRGWVLASMIHEMEINESTEWITEEESLLFRDKEGSPDLWLFVGTPYEVIQTENNWLQIRLPDGYSGWVNYFNIHQSKQ
jgi:hypothetical protein